MNIAWRAVIRVGIWLVAALIALYPVCHAVHMRPTFNLVAIASAANDRLLFRDFFFVVIVLVAAAFGNALYSLVREQTPTWFKGCTVLGCLYYVYVLTYGISRFSELAEMKAPIGLNDLRDDLAFMAFAGMITLMGELAISLTERGEDGVALQVARSSG
ncbi:MAG: hypothetical protein HZA66_12570 [Rhodopseudomonas palustris]|uniref:Uncharacterized protein n=1 Tax=Rhodopseudomonas palustris TaxID=1076 RepID=A0A933RY04_RHOPL|nr:hypothetical protein [Rhodopseudomonas palustris]